MRTELLTLTLLLASASARADVIVVDGAGGGDFTTLSAAVAAAADGDLILIREGVYVEPTPVVIDNKALTIAAEWVPSVGPFESFGPFEVELNAGLIVRNLPPMKPVVLQNLLLRGLDSTGSTPSGSGLVLLDNVSHVRVQNCEIYGGKGASQAHTEGGAAVSALNVGASALVSCRLFGGDGQSGWGGAATPGHGGPGLSKQIGQLLLYDTSSRGGRGGSSGNGGLSQAMNGGAGIVHGAGTLFLVGSSAFGGDGGHSWFGGDGGNGLELDGGGLAVWQLGGWSANGGSAGFGDSGQDGIKGVALYDPASLFTQYHGVKQRFDITSPVRENQVGQLHFYGDSSTWAHVFVSPALHQLPFPVYQGLLMLMPTSLIGPFIVAPPTNVNLPFTVPDMGPGFISLQVHVQPVYAGSNGAVLGPARVLTILDDSF